MPCSIAHLLNDVENMKKGLRHISVSQSSKRQVLNSLEMQRNISTMLHLHLRTTSEH